MTNKIMDDGLSIVGSLIIIYGTSLIYRPAGFIVAGAILLLMTISKSDKIK